jgi:hypothetical protein
MSPVGAWGRGGEVMAWLSLKIYEKYKSVKQKHDCLNIKIINSVIFTDYFSLHYNNISSCYIITLHVLEKKSCSTSICKC